MAEIVVIDLTTEDEDEEIKHDNDLQDVSRAQWTSAHTNRSSILRAILNEPFAGAVIVRSRAEALGEARQEYTQGYKNNGLVFWTDGSQRGDRAGTAVVYRKQYHTPIWTEKAWAVHGNAMSSDAELFGVAEAMKIALKTCKDARASPNHASEKKTSSVTIYSDSTATIDAINRFHRLSLNKQSRVRRQLEIARIRERALELQSMGIDVLLKWVPGHQGIEGNERADRQARKASGVRRRGPGMIIEDMIPQSEQSYIQNDVRPPVTRSARKRNKPILVSRRMDRFRKLFESLQKMTSRVVDGITEALTEE